MSLYMYGIRESDGMPISIFDIPAEMYGRRCGCVCPECGNPFEACSLAGKRERYFRHFVDKHNSSAENPTGCTAEHANESALHLMAKKIIEKEKKIYGAELAVDLSKLKLGLPEHIRMQLPKKRVFRAASTLDCKEVELEKTYSGFRPDASVTTAQGTYLIEIWHSHKTDELKLEKVIETGIPMLEIDVSSLVDECPNYEQLRKFITESADSRKWIFFPGEDERIEKAKTEYLQYPVVSQYMNEKEAERLKAEKREREYRKTKEYVAEAFDPSNYRRAVSALNSSSQSPHLGNDFNFYFHFYSQTKQIPFFVNIPIKGEIVFRCDRRIWQGKIFDRWIYNRKEGKINKFNSSALWYSLIEQEHIPYNLGLSKTADFSDEWDVINLPYVVISKYLDYLENLGFIETEWNWATVKQIRSIDPPNKEYAEALQKAIQKCDAGSLQVDNLITSELAPYFEAKAARKERELEEKIAAKRAAALASQKESQLRQERERLVDSSEIPIRFFDMSEIADADYDQEDYLIYDKSSRRWMKCIACNTAMPGFKIRKHETINKGVCRACMSSGNYR